MDWNDLKEYIGVGTDSEDMRLQAIWTSAKSMVDLAVADAFRPVPTDVLNLLYLEVGSSLYDRRNAPNTNSQFLGYEGTPVAVRQPRDPLATVRPIINRYVVPL